MRKNILLLTALWLGLNLPAQAEFPKNWYIEGVGDFLNGDILTTAIQADGSLSLGLEIKTLLNLPQSGAILDAERLDHRLLLGTANPAGVYQLETHSGKYQLTTLLERGQGVVSAVLPQKHGSALAALSPFGQIYRIHQGKAELIQSLNERYIWELQSDSKGGVYILTGDKGVLYRMDEHMKLQKLFQSDEANLKVLHQDQHWGLLIGGGSRGIVYRLREKGDVDALLDTRFSEITAMTGDGKGHVFVAATTANTAKNQPKSAVFLIDPQGRSEMLFRTNTETVFSLAIDPTGALLIGTGSQGRIYRFSDPYSAEKRLLSLPARSKSRQLVKMLPSQGQEMLLISSSPAQIESFQGLYLTKGEYESQIFESPLKARWGILRFDALLPPHTQIRAWSRSGNTAQPDKTWSPWSQAYTQGQGSPITSPPGKYLQLRFELSTHNPRQTPQLHSFDISYLRENLPPVLKDVYFLQRGVYFKPHLLGKVEGPRALELTPQILDKLRRPKGTEEIYQTLLAEKTLSPTRLLQEYRPGMLTLAWDAEDPNEDTLSYEVWYQRYGQKEWKKLADEILQPIFSFDTATLMEGAYHFRVVASDKLSNPDGGFRVSRDSQLITLDNSPPHLTALTFKQESGRLCFSFSAQDQTSPLAYAEYSLDGQPPVLFQSQDGIIDALAENFELVLPHPGKGSHMLVVRVVDRLGNAQTTQKSFEIP